MRRLRRKDAESRSANASIETFSYGQDSAIREAHLMSGFIDRIRTSVLRSLRRVAHFYRERRLALFRSKILLEQSWRILDLGCGDSQNAWLMDNRKVVGLDVALSNRALQPYPFFVLGDATCLPFPSSVFDLVFSNSMVEHLPTWDHQKCCADEIRRVGSRYWIQVPNRHFPIDPHYIIPFFQYLPHPAMKWWA